MEVAIIMKRDDHHSRRASVAKAVESKGFIACSDWARHGKSGGGGGGKKRNVTPCEG